MRLWLIGCASGVLGITLFAIAVLSVPYGDGINLSIYTAMRNGLVPTWVTLFILIGLIVTALSSIFIAMCQNTPKHTGKRSKQ